mgnify:FL=1
MNTGGRNVKIKEAIEKGMIELKVDNVEMPKLKARLLMQFILKKDRQYVIVNDMNNLTVAQEKKYFEYIKKLRKGIPLEYITHQREFMKLNFFVDENVLIPRADTEILVEEVIKIAKKMRAKKILDLCTGSGIIAVSLAKYIDNCEITATDISKGAIAIAKKNAIINKVEDKITFIESDLFSNIPNSKYDIIVSNPPYIKKEIINKLDKQVQKEPRIALDGGYDGLDFYRKIIFQAYEYLKYNGYLCFEIGYDQKEDVSNLLKNNGNYSITYSLKDLYDNDRVIVAKI